MPLRAEEEEPWVQSCAVSCSLILLRTLHLIDLIQPISRQLTARNPHSAGSKSFSLCDKWKWAGFLPRSWLSVSPETSWPLKAATINYYDSPGHHSFNFFFRPLRAVGSAVAAASRHQGEHARPRRIHGTHTCLRGLSGMKDDDVIQIQ